ncbi:MAG: hypothetical protein ACK5LG_21810 [Bacteroides thetaiotaomicron]
MRVNQEDYEDKLNQINHLNREVQCLRKKLDTAKYQRDLLIDSLTKLTEAVGCSIPNPTYLEKMRNIVADIRKQMGQSEML